MMIDIISVMTIISYDRHDKGNNNDMKIIVIMRVIVII